MRFIRLYIALVLMTLAFGVARSQDAVTEISIDFRVNSVVVDTLYHNNASKLRQMTEFFQNLRQDSTVNIVEVSFCGAASPEGSNQLNRRLARGRLSAIEKIVRSRINISDSIITRHDDYIPWQYLRRQVEMSTDLDSKDEILAIIDEEERLVDYHQPQTSIDNRVLELQRLDGGRVWQKMLDRYFARMRNAYVVVVTYRKPEPEPVSEPVTEPEPLPVQPAPVVEPDTIADPIIIIEEPTDSLPEISNDCNRHIYLKTNALGWGVALANIAVEADMASHWSVALPVYWSGWDYFKSTLKFRALAFYPEVRYWFSDECNDGWFVGAHAGLAWFNIATDGEYRYQDRDGNSPAIGGGLVAGYRMPISHDKRWKLEFSLGAGVYSVRYDKFRNVSDGLLVSTHKKTYFGLDQASVTFAYTFDLSK